ncbi:MAG: YciI family protein [Spirochaetales bacterium]|nr:YciI family protein [Spirochaetales bacterium]
MFIISLNYKADLQEVDKHLEAHGEYLKEEYRKGNFIASGRKVPRTGGVILSRIEEEGELEEVLRRDPFYRAGWLNTRLPALFRP